MNILLTQGLDTAKLADFGEGPTVVVNEAVRDLSLSLKASTTIAVVPTGVKEKITIGPCNADNDDLHRQALTWYGPK